MDFSEKLNYLFELTHAEGKELAAAMNITPPQISKMRNGIRGLPKHREDSIVLARFFAQRCNSDYQRESLAKKIKISQIQNIDDENALADIIYDWLSDEQSPDEYAARRADTFLRQFGSLFDKGNESATDLDSEKNITAAQSSFFTYYGGEGKRLATQTFLNYILQRGQACRINILTDENVAWISDDPTFSGRLQSLMMRLTEHGCTFRRVAAPISDMEQAFESINRWLPLYIAGKAQSYYYKRMRDNLNRITLLVVPGVAVMCSFSIGNEPRADAVTFFTADERASAALAVEFEKYFALCEPIMHVHNTLDSFEGINECMMRYEDYEADCISRSDSLSFITLPWNIATGIGDGANEEHFKSFLAAFAKRYKSFKTNLEKHTYLDIIRLANIDDIMDGAVPIPACRVLSNRGKYYTPSEYLQHLRCILFLLEHSENYYAVTRKPDDDDLAIMYVKEGCVALLARDMSPFSVFEVSEHFLVDAFMEYLRRNAPDRKFSKQIKRDAIEEIRELIAQIEYFSHISEES